MARRIATGFILLLAFLTSAASAAPLRHRATSETAMTSSEGRPYRILVSAPDGPAPAGGFPVLYVLDGDAWFGTAVEIARMREYEKLPPALVVGIAYPGGAFFDAKGRSWDFTPPGSSDPDMEGIALGGADAFLAFLNGALKPWIRAHYETDPAKQILFGHSLGGLFVLHALFKAPEDFNVYIAGSPSIRFAGRAILKEEPLLAANPRRASARLLVTVGGLESHPAPALVDDYRRYYAAHPEAIPGQTVSEAVAALFPDDPAFDKSAELSALVTRLAHGGVRATFVEFAGEEHLSAAVSALNRGIPFALRPPD